MSSEEVAEVCRNIISFRRRGEYVQGHSYIASLDKSIRHSAAVAIEAIPLYIVQGHYIHAWDECRAPASSIFVDDDPANSFTPEICDIDSACLALISAFVGISRYGRVATAMRVADRVYTAWLAPDRKSASRAGFSSLTTIR